MVSLCYHFKLMQNQASSDAFSHSLKKSILWNAVEPGDPYDIKKSIIAKLPGDKKVFMGNKLEVLCLLQAAEIERLVLNLEDYKVKLREIEKSELDRHSYEIQIKQLAARIQGEEQLRTENGKLKQFIDRLNQELEEQRQRMSSGSNELNNKYQQALAQIQLSNTQNSQLSSEVVSLRKLIETKTVQLVNSEMRIKQLEEQFVQSQQREQKIREYESQFIILGKEIERLNYVLKSKAEEVRMLSDQLARSEANVRSTKEENEYLINNQIGLNEELNQLRDEIKRSKYEEDQSRFREYEERIEELQQELSKCRAQQDQINNLKGETDHLRGIISQLQHNSSLISHQVERLNGVLKGKVDENTTFQVRANRLTEENHFYVQQITILEKESGQLKQIHRKMEDLEFQLSKEQAAKERLAKINSDLLKKQAEFDQSKLEQYELKQSMLSQEVMRLSDANESLEYQLKAMREKTSQSEMLQQQFKRVSRELIELKSLMAQEDITKKNAQERANELSKKCTDYQKLINDLSGEIQRLNEILRTKLQEVSILENKMQYLAGEKHRLDNELHQHGDKDSKIEDYENKFALISLEVERLNNNLKMKVQQGAELQQQLALLSRKLQQKEEELARSRSGEAKANETQAELQKLNHILKSKLDQLREKDGQLHRLQADNDSLRAELRQAKSKQKEISDLERLNNLLRLKVEEAARWESSNHELVQQITTAQNNLQSANRQSSALKIQIQQLAGENNTLIAQLNEYKNKVAQILKEFERLQQMLEGFRKENYELKVQLSGGNLKEKNQKLLEEIERLNKVIEQMNEEIKELRLILSQDHAFQRRVREQLSLIVILCAEIESLRKRVEEKEREVQDVRRESLVPLKA